MKDFSILCLAFLLLFNLSGCERQEILMIEEEKMVEVLVDLSLKDQIVRRHPVFNRDSISNLLTQQLLIIHNISQEQLDTNLYLYQFDLVKHARISEKVIKKLEDLKNISSSHE